LRSNLKRIWPNCIISLCSWHAKRAVSQYLSKSQQSPFADKHSPLNYLDPNHQRGWDAMFLDSDWIRLIHDGNERAFRARITPKFRHINDPKKLEEEIQKEGKKLQVCVTEIENRNKIVEVFMSHLKWHYLTHDIIMADEAKHVNIYGVWYDHTVQMHELCQSLGEAYAWEYLWKS
jgi:hypothetical protein